MHECFLIHPHVYFCRMKIAVPTNDGLKIATDLGLAEAFLVITIKAEAIVGEELRKNQINTEENLITNAILRYLEHEYRNEANTCCCP